MTWTRHDYYAESDTHRINWSWNGQAWCVLLWDRAEKRYTKRRFCDTEQDKERAIAAFKEAAGEPKSLRKKA